MSVLKGSHMSLSRAERHWLPLWGATGKFAMRRACWLNRHMLPVIEQTFEGIAQIRVRLLTEWAQTAVLHLSVGSLH
ncbi:hypothetical protein [Marinobacterium weihaiense]|uniref:Uncharacterized protein n=1 Tax=Marinobacterium weihaiense TaxID=2851016 RepID=A0ABS6M8W1_9GAMM|nr:hypothetical protein [Marinobacterium weihaiense]MBV0932722.1 hypothetical protein [Marinobacterium weihaiense]